MERYKEPQELDIDNVQLNNELEVLKVMLQNDNIVLDELAKEKLNLFTRYLLKWNTVMNLTAITDIEQMILKHYYDSIAPLFKLGIPQNATCIDVGTGAGFPSVPLKIIRPDLKLTLLDSLQKRVNFLNGAISLLDFKNTETIHSRAEDAGQNKSYRGKYDVAFARAVAPLNVLCEYCLPFVKVGGCFVAYKGLKANEEISSSKSAISLLGGELESIIEVTLPNEEGVRQVILIRKISHTPPKYPRKSAIIAKTPL